MSKQCIYSDTGLVLYFWIIPKWIDYFDFLECNGDLGGLDPLFIPGYTHKK